MPKDSLEELPDFTGVVMGESEVLLGRKTRTKTSRGKELGKMGEEVKLMELEFKWAG